MTPRDPFPWPEYLILAAIAFVAFYAVASLVKQALQ